VAVRKGNLILGEGFVVSGADGWFTSSFSGPVGHRVEARFLGSGGVAIRHSRDGGSAVLRYTPAEWDAFVEGVKAGEFDRPCRGDR
jgi:hypothetical protein